MEKQKARDAFKSNVCSLLNWNLQHSDKTLAAARYNFLVMWQLHDSYDNIFSFLLNISVKFYNSFF